MAEEQNYVVGRGRLYFGQYATGTRVAQGQRYFGNTPELSLAQSEDVLDHYSAEGGVRVKDDSITLQNDSSGSFSCDNIQNENLALWFRGATASQVETGSVTATGTITFSVAVPSDGDDVTINGTTITFVAADPAGDEVLIAGTIGAQATALANYINAHPELGVTAEVAAAVVTISAAYPGDAGNDITLAKTGTNIAVSDTNLAGGTDVTEDITNVTRGLYYQLGVTASKPQGLRNVGTVTITGVADTSFTVDYALGRIYLHPDAPDIADGDDIEVNYGVQAGTDEVVIASTDVIEGELAFFADNPAGTNRDYFWPRVRLSPDGDYALKGDDWQTMSFNFEILLRDSATQRQYIVKR